MAVGSRHVGSVAEVADDLGCDWHTVDRAVIAYGLALVDDPDRIGPVATLGLLYAGRPDWTKPATISPVAPVNLRRA